MVYSQLAYANTMYVFGGINTIGLVLTCCLLPNELNKTVEENEVAQFEAELEDLATFEYNDGAKKKKLNITTWTVWCNRHCFFALLVVLMGCFNTTFFTGFLGNTLIAMGLEDWHVGLVYAVQSFFYLLTAMSLPYTCEHLSRKVMFLLAMFFFGADMFLIGPS